MDEKIIPTFDPARVPGHVAIIMDGNGRWAAAQGLPRVEGHRAGAKTLRTILEACGEWGIRWLTVYAFSTENWKRPEHEVNALMLLLEHYLVSEADELERNGIRLRVIGDTGALPVATRTALERTIERLSVCTEQTLTLALNYGGRDEIVRAARAIAVRTAAGEVRPENITEDLFSSALDTAGAPDPDLLIRTAGELRLSNFMLWQLSYAELYATPACWPDFGRAELAAAIVNYQSRTRKFGALAAEEN